MMLCFRRLSRSITFAAVVLLAVPSFAQQSRPKLDPIPLLDHVVKVEMEVDASDEDLLAFVKELLRSPAGATSVTVPMSIGGMPIPMGQIEAVLTNVKRLRMLSCVVAEGQGSQVSSYAKAWGEEGFEKMVAYAPEDQGEIVVMRTENASDGLAIAFQQNSKLTLIRTAGMPNMKVLGAIVRRMMVREEVPAPHAQRPQPLPAKKAAPVKKKG